MIDVNEIFLQRFKRRMFVFVSLIGEIVLAALKTF